MTFAFIVSLTSVKKKELIKNIFFINKVNETYPLFNKVVNSINSK